MENIDPFDEILMRCLSDKEEISDENFSANTIKRSDLTNCHNCNELIFKNFRYCPNCGEPTVDISSEITRNFMPVMMQKKLLRVSILDVDPDFRANGEYYTRIKLRIENLTNIRLHLSLTYINSVIIDMSGKQLNPVDGEVSDLPEVFDPWFYIYPHAYIEGYIIFPELHDRIRNIYISCISQNADEEELFCFSLT